MRFSFILPIMCVCVCVYFCLVVSCYIEWWRNEIADLSCPCTLSYHSPISELFPSPLFTSSMFRSCLFLLLLPSPAFVHDKLSLLQSLLVTLLDRRFFEEQRRKRGGGRRSSGLRGEKREESVGCTCKQESKLFRESERAGGVSIWKAVCVEHVWKLLR